jgi:hypothetical protein
MVMIILVISDGVPKLVEESLIPCKVIHQPENQGAIHKFIYFNDPRILAVDDLDDYMKGAEHNHHKKYSGSVRY